MITQAELKEVVHYEPSTGKFTWIAPASPKVKPGQTAGTFPAGNSYPRLRINKRQYLSHRLAWLYENGKFPPNGFEIDHIDNDRTNTRIGNLRLATRSQNRCNSLMRQGASSGCKGVTWIPNKNRWVVQTKFAGVPKYLGCFKQKAEAMAAYAAFAINTYKEFYNSGIQTI